MNRLFPLFASFATVWFMTGCFYPPTVPYPQGNPYGYQGPGSGPPPSYYQEQGPGAYGPGGPQTQYGDPYASQDSASGQSQPSQQDTPSTSGNTTPPSTGAQELPIYPEGIPIPGNPNLVRSPYTDDGEVNVEGFPSGSPVRCPFTGGIFVVP